MVFFLSTLLLICAVADDLYSRKIHNKLIVAFFFLCLFFIFFGERLAFQSPGIDLGLMGFLKAVFRVFLALALALPFVFLKVMGGGDMKLFLVLSLLLAVSDIFLVFCFLFFGRGFWVS